MSTEDMMKNTGLIHFTLKRYFGTPLGSPDYEDYFQEGFIGLMEASKRFDESKGFEFNTFAVAYIRGYIQRYKREREAVIRIPRHLKSMQSKAASMYYEGFSFNEIQQSLFTPEEELIKLIQMSFISSLDTPLSDESDFCVGDNVSTELDEYENSVGCSSVIEAIEEVSKEIHKTSHRELWEEWIFLSLQGYKIDQRYLGRKYGFSQSYVSRLLRKYKHSLKLKLENYDIYV